MADPSRDADTRFETDRDSGGGMPGWVRVTGIILVIVVLLVVVMLVATGGPGGHVPPEGLH
jgi:hypothetical protein